MSFYVFEVDVQPNTLQTAPLIQKQEVDNPYLIRMEINIPNGHQGLAKLQIASRERILVPTPGSNPMWIRGDGNQIEITPMVKLDGPIYQLYFYAYNDDTVNDHTFIINMDVVSEEQFKALMRR